MNMLEKTIELALQKARKNNVAETEQERIVGHINTAFMSYADSWEGAHTLEETKEEWEWFYNLLNEQSLEDALAELERDYAKRHSGWVACFIVVIKILQNPPGYKRWIDELDALYWKIVNTPAIPVTNLDKANNVILEAIEKLRPLAKRSNVDDKAEVKSSSC